MAEAEAWVMIPKLDKDKTGCVLDMRPLVLCKDCIHWDKHTEECGNPDSVCFRNGWCKPDWFCADGERRRTIKRFDDYVHYFKAYCSSDVEDHEMLKAVLSMLKEQEAVEPTLIREGRNKNYNDYVCPRCDNEVVYEQNYCSECGIPFMWEGR